jgi:hypothetical protein
MLEIIDAAGFHSSSCMLHETNEKGTVTKSSLVMLVGYKQREASIDLKIQRH